MASERGSQSNAAASARDSQDGPAWLETQYNMRIRHPERDAVYKEYQRRSERLRASLPCHLDLRYAEGPRAVLDLFPAAEGGRLLLFIHGGYWRALDKSVFSFVAGPFVAEGFSVALINYDLAPAVTLDVIVEQIRQAIGWLVRDADAYRINATDMVVAGHSAGGHLAVSALNTDWAARGLPANSVAAAVSISGIYELEPLLGTSINADVRLDRETARRLSLRDKVDAGGGPVALFVGGDESQEFRRQTLDFGSAWSASGHPVETAVIPGRNHFTIIGDLADRNAPIYGAARTLLGGGSGPD